MGQGRPAARAKLCPSVTEPFRSPKPLDPPSLVTMSQLSSFSTLPSLRLLWTNRSTCLNTSTLDDAIVPRMP